MSFETRLCLYVWRSSLGLPSAANSVKRCRPEQLPAQEIFTGSSQTYTLYLFPRTEGCATDAFPLATLDGIASRCLDAVADIETCYPRQGFGEVEVVTRSQDRALPEWVVQLQRKGTKQELQRATVRKEFPAHANMKMDIRASSGCLPHCDTFGENPAHIFP